MHALANDLRHALRVLRRSPGFACVAVLTLAIGIGGTTALFSAVDGVLLRPLPFAQEDRLVAMSGTNASYLDMKDWESGVPALESVALHAVVPWHYDRAGPEAAERVDGTPVSPRFFEVLRARPARGRVFTAADGEAGARVAVLSDAFWRRLGADPGLVGGTITLNGFPYVVSGVMPPGFRFPHERAELWTSIPLELPDVLRHRGIHAFRGLGRLRDGASAAAAQAQLDVLERRMAAADPGESSALDWTLAPLRREVVGDARTVLLVLFGGVALVLLIACANVAGLQLARGAARRREIAIRRALGAGSARLARQLLVESVTLAVLGGAAGLLVAAWGAGALGALGPEDVPRATGIALDARVLGFALLVSVATGLAFGAAPALAGARAAPAAALAEDGRGAGGRARTRLRRVLVAGEVAVALVLLAGSALVVRTLWNLGRVDPGFDSARVLAFEITLPESRYEEIPPQTRFVAALEERLRALPGVEAAGAVGDLPVADDNYVTHNLAVEGRQYAPGEEPEIPHRPATPGYFEALGIPVIRGRGLTPSDRDDAPPVAVVNRTMARMLWPHGDAVGSRIRWARDDASPWITVVGVVGDVRSNALREPDEPAVYTPHAQTSMPWRRIVSFVVRASGDAAALLPSVEREVAALDSAIPVVDARTMDRVLGDSLRRLRLEAGLLAAFAAVALALAALGIYGVIAQVVSERRREIGIRVALGAVRSDVVRLVVGQGLRLAAMGVALGAAAALAATRVLRAVLYGVEPGDPLTVAAVAAAALAAAALASWLPARRAAAVAPAEALRS
ncbi:MAG TPA: ABC transporter permease [Gemmatimonadota bacterium]